MPARKDRQSSEPQSLKEKRKRQQNAQQGGVIALYMTIPGLIIQIAALRLAPFIWTAARLPDLHRQKIQRACNAPLTDTSAAAVKIAHYIGTAAHLQELKKARINKHE